MDREFQKTRHRLSADYHIWAEYVGPMQNIMMLLSMIGDRAKAARVVLFGDIAPCRTASRDIPVTLLSDAE